MASIKSSGGKIGGGKSGGKSPVKTGGGKSAAPARQTASLFGVNNASARVGSTPQRSTPVRHSSTSATSTPRRNDSGTKMSMVKKTKTAKISDTYKSALRGAAREGAEEMVSHAMSGLSKPRQNYTASDSMTKAVNKAGQSMTKKRKFYS